MSDQSAQTENFEQLLRTTTGELVDKIEQGHLADAVNLLQKINDARNYNLYLEVGRLTRALHDAIRDFHLDTSNHFQSAPLSEVAAQDTAETDISEMADARDRLNYVLNLTQQAADRTMDKVEESLPLVTSWQTEVKSLRVEWERLIRREMKPEEFRQLYHRMDGFLRTSEEEAGQLVDNLSQITLAQDYQDLTGQVVKKVITLVHEVESSLVGLVRMASQVDQITGIQHPHDDDASRHKAVNDTRHLPEGPIVNAEKRGIEVVSGQDEVDDLLSSLGF